MHAWLCETLEGVEKLRWAELPTPEPKAGEVRIAIKAASLNFPDLLTVKGQYQFKPPLPFVPGSEFAGHVEAVGEGVKHVQVGQAVACVGSSGGFGTHACVAAASVMPLPPGFDIVDGAAFGLTYGTSHHALLDRAQLKAGETVLVLGAAGGVGLAMLDVARALGAKVVAAASTDAKLQLCIERGAHGVVDYSSEDLKTRVRELTDGGADVAVDTVGGELGELALRSLGNFGRLLVIGFASGSIPRLPANQVLLRNRSVLGVDWGAWAMADPAGNSEVMSEVLALVEDGVLRPAEPTSYALADAGTALRDLLERRITGKVCLTP